MIKETKEKRIFVCNRTQSYVAIHTRKEWGQLRDFLIKKGFDNIHSLSAFRRPRPPVIVIDLVNHKFASTNTTCLAAVASCGIKPMMLEDFFRLYNQ